MPPETPIAVNRQHYDQIVADHERICALAGDIGEIKDSIKEVANSLRKCVEDHETRIRKIEAEAADLRGRFAVIVATLGIVAGWIGSLLPGWLGRV